jgi:hypothetical protein
LKHCPSERCPHLRRHGRPAEFQDELAQCLDCGAALEPGRAPDPESDEERPPLRPPVAIPGPTAILTAYDNVPSAYLARALLESEGIPARVLDEQAGSMAFLYAFAVRGVKVEVLARDLARAREILAEDRVSDLQELGLEPEPSGVCPRCGAPEVRRNPRRIPSVAVWVLLRLPIVFGPRRRRCTACGFRWRVRRSKGPRPAP